MFFAWLLMTDIAAEVCYQGEKVNVGWTYDLFMGRVAQNWPNFDQQGQTTGMSQTDTNKPYNAPAIEPAGSRLTWYLTLVVFCIALTVYAISLAPGLLWQDSGMAQVRTLQGDAEGTLGLALSHPLYYQLTSVFQWIPIGEGAYRTNLVSAVFGAVTVAGIFLFLLQATRRRLPAVIGALSLGVAHTFWQHCALAEAYTVSTALLALELFCLQRFVQRRHNAWLIALMLLNGLGTSNHMLATLSLSCYAVMILWLIARRQLRVRIIPLLTLAWMVGASFYVNLIYVHLSQGEDVKQVFHSALFGMRYASNVLNISIGTRQLINSVLYMGMNFPTPLALLAIVGLRTIWQRPRRLDLTTCAGLWLVHMVFAIRYDVPDQYTFFIPGIVLTALLIGLGAERFVAAGATRRGYLLLCAAILPVAIYVALPNMVRASGKSLGTQRDIPFRDTYDYFLHPWKTWENGPRRFASHLNDLLPANAVLFADGTTVRPLQYLRLSESWRPDVLLYPPIDNDEDVDDRFGQHAMTVAISESRVYVVTPQAPYCPEWLAEGYQFEKAGMIYRVIPPH